MCFIRLQRKMIHKVVILLGLLIGIVTSPISAKEVTLQQIQQRGTLKVGLEGTYPPFSFQDPQGKLTGYEVELAEMLATKLGVIADIRPTKWDGMLASLEAGRVDIVMNQVIITPQRQLKYNFSAPYTVSGIQVLVKKGREGEFPTAQSLTDKKVGVGLGSNYEEWLQENVPGVVVRTYDDDATKYQDLRIGRTDAILVDRLAALDIMQKTKGTLVLAGEPFARQEAGIALRKSDLELLTALDNALIELRKTGELARLSEKWFTTDVSQ